MNISSKTSNYILYDHFTFPYITANMCESKITFDIQDDRGAIVE